MHDRGASGTSMEKQGSDFDSHFETDQHLGEDQDGHRASCEWMPRGEHGGRRAMRMAMMMNLSRGYGMDHGFHDGWSGFDGKWGRRHGHSGRRRGRHGKGRRGYFVDDDDENVTSMAEQMNECHLKEGCKQHDDGSSESSSSSSSSSESDDEQNAHDGGRRQPRDSEVLKMEGQLTGQVQQETNAAEMEKERASSSTGRHHPDHGNRGYKHGRGHHKHHHHGRFKHHRHAHFHRSMMPPPIPPHLLGFNRPPFPPMHHQHFHDCHGNRHFGKKFFKKSMKQWYKAQKIAWKQEQMSQFYHQQRRQRSDGDEATSGCENDADFVHPETAYQLPPPWFLFAFDHHGYGHGRRGSCCHGKKGEKLDKRLRKRCSERSRPALEDAAATKTQLNAADGAEKVYEVHDENVDDQAPIMPMEDAQAAE